MGCGEQNRRKSRRSVNICANRRMTCTECRIGHNLAGRLPSLTKRSTSLKERRLLQKGVLVSNADKGVRRRGAKSFCELKGNYLFFFSWAHLAQYHLPLGFEVSPTQPKWNHSIGQSRLSHPIISPVRGAERVVSGCSMVPKLF